MTEKDRSASLREEIQELGEEAAALADRASKTARLADDLNKRIKRLEKEAGNKK
ncbi:MAG: hypothetical protein ABSC33_05420 [Candidatus Sulfotelmatobacter sp.]|jgi:predicted nuclease with TOPRIM domain